MIENDIAKLRREVDSLKAKNVVFEWEHEHLKEVVELILKDLCLEVVEVHSRLELRPTYHLEK